MAIDFLGPVMPGQRIQNTAARASATAKATNDVRHPRSVPSGRATRSGINLHSTVVLVSNDGEDPIEAGQPVTIKESAIVDPEENRDEWRKCEFIDGGAEVGADKKVMGVWGIALQLIEPGFAGPVLMSGVTTVKVKKRKGEDMMVDMPCFRDPESNERALYTSAAGCAVILDIPELEDEDEGEAIVHVLGYRTKEPPMWALIPGDTPLRHISEPEEHSRRLASVMRCIDSGLETGVSGRFENQRKVEVRCVKLADKQLTGEVKIEPDVWSGIWLVEDSLRCPEPVPPE